MITVDCKAQFIEFYHGSSVDGLDRLLPPSLTSNLSEKGRLKNLNKVFYTADKGLAKIYARRAARSCGGNPVLYRVIAPVNSVCMSDIKGATVYCADFSFLEKIEDL